MRHLFLCSAVIVGLIGCPAWADDLPDPKLTPGVADPKMMAAELSDQSKATARRPPISKAVRGAVYGSYGMPWGQSAMSL